MEYWVIMDKEELEFANGLLGGSGLRDVFVANQPFTPSEAVARQMLKKRFFYADGNRQGWNPFVQAVLYSTLFAQSELQVIQDNGNMCCIYFHGEDMILLKKETDPEQYIFYYVPLIPKAIGGLAKCLEHLEDAMGSRRKDASVTVPDGQVANGRYVEADTGADIKRLVSGTGMTIDTDFPALHVKGWRKGKLVYIADIIKTLEGCWFYQSGTDVQRESSEDKIRGDSVCIESIDYYSLLQKMSRWIVKEHGRYIAAKENENVSV